jgi:hypothetical protein
MNDDDVEVYVEDDVVGHGPRQTVHGDSSGKERLVRRRPSQPRFDMATACGCRWECGARTLPSARSISRASARSAVSSSAQRVGCGGAGQVQHEGQFVAVVAVAHEFQRQPRAVRPPVRREPQGTGFPDQRTPRDTYDSHESLLRQTSPSGSF